MMYRVLLGKTCIATCSASGCKTLPAAGATAPGLGLGLGLEGVFVFDRKSENGDRAVEAVESVSEARSC